MRNVKYAVVQFAFYDRTGIQKYLEKQARKGWMLEKIGSIAWKFRRMEPKNIYFSVTYFPSATAYDPYPSFRQEQFQEFCAHAGWFPAASNAQMQIFYNQSEAPVPIETDALMEVQNIHKAMKKSFLPSYFLLLLCALSNLVTFAFNLTNDFVETLSNGFRFCLGLLWLMLALMELIELTGYFVWRHKACAAAERDGSFVETGKERWIIHVLLFGVVTAIIGMLASLGGWMILIGAADVALILGTIVLITFIRDRMKEDGVTKEENKAYTTIITVVLCLVVCFLVAVTAETAVEYDWFGLHSGQEYRHGSSSYTQYLDPMPLRAEDLMGETDDEYSYYIETQSTIFLRKTFAEQYHILGSDGEYRLKYIILDVKLPLIYDAYLEEYLDDTYREIDAEIWGTDSAYQRYQQGEWQNNYLLCTGNRIIVVITYDHDLTVEQMAIAGEVLRNCK